MSDLPGASLQNGGGLVDYYEDWGPQRFRRGDGKPVKRRALQLKIHEFALPVIKVTKATTLIDPVQGDNRLREYALEHDRTPRRPGRPARHTR
jgi:hypothetical protein